VARVDVRERMRADRRVSDPIEEVVTNV